MSSPELQNEALQDLAQMFLDDPLQPTPGHDLLDSSRFDFTVGSLVAMDEHIDEVRRLQLPDHELSIFILRAGAYVGEVIRRFTPAPREWNWLAYADAAKLDSTVASYGMSISTAAVLWSQSEGIIFPLAKVTKFIQNGPEDSVHFYAQVIISGPPKLG